MVHVAMAMSYFALKWFFLPEKEKKERERERERDKAAMMCKGK